MTHQSKIEWTDASWNPIRASTINHDGEQVGWHCEKISEACRNCYAEAMNMRLGTKLGYAPKFREDIGIFLDEKLLLAPLHWKQPRKIFLSSMTDIFADFVKDEWLDRIFAVMALCPQHTFQVLTKRPERMREYIGSQAAFDENGQPAEAIRIAMTVLVGTPSRRAMAPALKAIPLGKFCASGPWPLPNVWLGVTAENQKAADERIPLLLDTPASIRWVSIEPMLGPVDFTPEADEIYQKLSEWYGPNGFDETGSQPRQTRRHGYFPCIDWVVAGGESGKNARPSHPDWFRALRDQCTVAGVPFLFKQWGEWIEFDHESETMEVDADSFEAEGAMDACHRPAWIALDGRVAYDHADIIPDLPMRLVDRIGKKAAGRLLDGKLHDAFPEAS